MSPVVLAASRRVLARVLVVAATAAVVSCGNDDAGPPFVVGAGDAVESRVLAEIYAGALARTGLPVTVLPELGERAEYLAALDAGRVALVGEHTGELLAHYDSGSAARTPSDVIKDLNRSLPEGLVVSDPADGTDLRPRVLVTAEAARRDDVDSVAELAPRCAELRAGVAPAPDVLRVPAAAPLAGCAFAGETPFADAVALRNALLDSSVQAGVVGGPSALTAAVTDGLTVLTDADYALRAENVVPVFRKGLLDDQRVRKLNYVAGELTTDELVEMIRRVRDGAVAGDVARTWLDAHGL
ncbi:glycine betaine ABC transporter substrate-binding protein [Nocardia bhagyanarayanae]|uniref:Osmoprotectant transport system substrate-binding protein n=1 Tax=Nocardia bhagyanarayanae TaxID=1215925 RepID=A0A543FAC6_9NOCA|nr:glycine betaine ABC transporter substrate-binding protein [Nocardia bhagyanarayanae]TQM30787.1 osmoprotectant transport system substrate-binding protein [Nocardia bhagyanarayanae]